MYVTVHMRAGSTYERFNSQTIHGFDHVLKGVEGIIKNKCLRS